jgi:hypothetical protein
LSDLTDKSGRSIAQAIRIYLRIAGRIAPFLIIAFLVVGYLMPFEDYQGQCTICGTKIFRRTSPWLADPIDVTSDSKLSRFYASMDLPEHEHQWEFVGGYTKTNLFSVPSRYQFERSEVLLLVPEERIIEILSRVELKNAQIELIRAINCDDEDVRELVRQNLYEMRGVDDFIKWWEEFAKTWNHDFPCSVLP